MGVSWVQKFDYSSGEKVVSQPVNPCADVSESA